MTRHQWLSYPEPDAGPGIGFLSFLGSAKKNQKYVALCCMAGVVRR
jgi:hypothetical protein